MLLQTITSNGFIQHLTSYSLEVPDEDCERVVKTDGTFFPLATDESLKKPKLSHLQISSFLQPSSIIINCDQFKEFTFYLMSGHKCMFHALDNSISPEIFLPSQNIVMYRIHIECCFRCAYSEKIEMQ